MSEKLDRQFAKFDAANPKMWKLYVFYARELKRAGRIRGSSEQITAATGDDWCSASARLRDLRKNKHGGWDVQRRSVGGGLFEYRLMSK